MSNEYEWDIYDGWDEGPQERDPDEAHDDMKQREAEDGESFWDLAKDMSEPVLFAPGFMFKDQA